jgi:hypothetical protein
MSGEAEVKHCLEAMAACTQDDIVHWNWSIELVNSQVGRMRKGVSVQCSLLPVLRIRIRDPVPF